jgi:hypothetical protein
MILFVAPFAVYFGLALLRGYNLARQGDYLQHREWMIRALAIASAIATQRLILVPTLVVLGDDPDTIRWASMLSFTSAFALHAVISEAWINRTRPARSLPDA